jgi:hypothetical protein
MPKRLNSPSEGKTLKEIVGVDREQKQGRGATIKGLRGRKYLGGIAKRQSKGLKGIAH